MTEDRHATRFVLRVLRRLMGGERLSVADLIRDGRLKDDFVRRHLAILEDEIPGIRQEGKWGRIWRYETMAQGPNERFRLLALMMAHTLLSSLRGSELDANLGELVLAEQQRLGSSGSPPVDVSRMFFAKSRMINPLGLEPDIVDRITKAMHERCRLNATYELFDGTVSRVCLEPYTLVFADDGLYLVGRCVDSELERHIDTLRIHNIERIRNITLTKEGFLYPPRDQYTPDELFRHCFGIFLPPKDAIPVEVVLSFAPHWSAFLRRHRWHDTQMPPQIAQDGRVLVSFRSLYLTRDLIHWIRSFGSEVSVVETLELRGWVESGVDPQT